MIKIIVAISLSLVLFFANFVQAEQYTILSGGMSGIYYGIAEEIRKMLDEKSGGELILKNYASGASAESVRLLNGSDNIEREGDFAIAQNDIVFAAYTGEAPFKRTFIDMRAIMRLYPEYIHCLAKVGSGIQSLEDFKGKRIAVGAKGSGNELNARNVLSAANLTYNDITPVYSSYADSIKLLEADQIDGLIVIMGTPNSMLTELTVTNKVSFINLPEETIDILRDKYPWLMPSKIAANTYKGQTEVVNTLSMQAILITHKSIPEEVVYQLTKLICENIQDIAVALPTSEKIDKRKFVMGVPIPFHEGADIYLRSIGVR